jgi:MYXO-CTERM domain-containing protein
MRHFAVVALALICSAVPAKALAKSSGPIVFASVSQTPGEPPTAVLVMTGVAGIAFMRRRKRAVQ